MLVQFKTLIIMLAILISGASVSAQETDVERNKIEDEILKLLKDPESNQPNKSPQVQRKMEDIMHQMLNSRFKTRAKARPELWKLVKSKDVRENLELINDQAQQIEEILANEKSGNKRLFDRRQSFKIQHEDGTWIVDPARTEEHIQFVRTVGAQSDKLAEETKTQVLAVLLPHQKQRLQQIAVQLHIQKAGEGEVLLHPTTKEFLDISDEQETRISERVNEVSQMLEEGNSEFAAKARKDMLSQLTAKQRSLLDELQGEKFELGDRLLRNIRSRPTIMKLARIGWVSSHIEIVDAQKDQLWKITVANTNMSNELYKEFRDHITQREDGRFVLNESHKSEYKKRDEEIQKAYRAQLDEVLLPHQLTRLQQIATQVHIQKQGIVAAIMHPDTAEALSISDAQMKKIEKRSAEVVKKLVDEKKSLKEKARKMLLAELTAQQRERFQELTGDAIDLKNISRLRL